MKKEKKRKEKSGIMEIYPFEKNKINISSLCIVLSIYQNILIIPCPTSRKSISGYKIQITKKTF